MTATPPASHIEAEIATQPQDWLEAKDAAAEYAALLPHPGERVAVVGCGTSYYMAQTYASLRESAGLGITDAWSPTEARLDRGYDRLLAITRSGHDDRDRRPADRTTRTGSRPRSITSSPGTPVLDLAAPILTPAVDEQLRGPDPVRDDDAGDAALAPGRGPRPGDRAGPAVLDAGEGSLGPAATADQITFVGRGWTDGIAQEAALKLRESAQLWTEAYSMMEYRHGPVSISAPGRVVWAFGDLVEGFADDIAVTGADLLHSPIDALADLLRVHLSLRRPGPRRRVWIPTSRAT